MREQNHIANTGRIGNQHYQSIDANTTAAVSYTHLDVYKRQAYRDQCGAGARW